MIAKITHGRSASQALAYDHGPGRADEHVNPHRVAGNIPGRDWQVRAHTMQRFVAAHQNKQQNTKARDEQNREDQHRGGHEGKPERGVYRIALANPKTDRVLSDAEWRQIADKFVTRFAGKDGVDMGPWEATRHDAHHIHLTISKYGYDGSRMSESHDYRRVASICRDLEQEHGLSNAAARSGRGSGRVRADREAEGRGEPPKDRDWLRETVGRVLKDGGGIEELRNAGVDVKLNQASTGRISGISYSKIPARTHELDRQEEQMGAQIWFKGSQLGKAYSWNQVREQLDRTQEHGRPKEGEHRAESTRGEHARPAREPDTPASRHPDSQTTSGRSDSTPVPATTGADGGGGRGDTGDRQGGPDTGGSPSGGAGQSIRDPGGPWMPPGEISGPPMTRRQKALEIARRRQAERDRRREQSRDDHGRER